MTITLPAVEADLSFRPRDLQWTISAYPLAFAGALVVAGRAADLYGRRRLFVAGLAVFGVASLGCAAATTPALLLAARAVQGLGAAALAPSALAILVAIFPAGRRLNAGVAWYTAAQAVGGASGWVVGGVVSDHVGWRWLFVANVPVCVAAVLTTWRALPADPSAVRGGARQLDYPGALLVTTGITLVVLGLTQVGAGGSGWSVAVGLGAGPLLLALLTRVERRAASPLVPARLLRRKALVTGLAVALVLTAATTSVLLLCSLYLQHVAGWSAATSGLAFVPFNLAVIAASMIGPMLLRRLAPDAAMVLGLGAICAGSVVLMALPEHGPPLVVTVPAFVLLGLGNGLAAVAAVSAGTRAAGDSPGVASGLLNSASEFGVALGLAVLVTIASARTAALSGVRPAAALLDGYRWAFAAGAVVAAAVALAVLATSRPRPGRRGVRPVPAGPRPGARPGTRSATRRYG
ncbi:MFS transporter [Micromonospora sp. NPDC049559]|uniref:MFS transporter n=1 Tax=Micromonospora sp. NPDC049559 TaxID=3155923 RepID=UPI00342BACFF